MTDFGLASAAGEDGGGADVVGHARVHGARAARRTSRDHPERPLLARPCFLRALYRQEGIRGRLARGVEAQTRRALTDRAIGRETRPRPGGRARDPPLPRERAGTAATLGRRRGAALPGGDPSPPHRGGRDAFARDGRGGGQRRRHETRGGVGLSGSDPRGNGARRLSVAACLPPWPCAAGEAARSSPVRNARSGEARTRSRCRTRRAAPCASRRFRGRKAPVRAAIDPDGVRRGLGREAPVG